MRPEQKEQLKFPQGKLQRMKRSRSGKKNIWVQAKCLPESSFRFMKISYRTWKNWSRYHNIKDSENAISALSKGVWKTTLKFRVHPENVK